MKRPSLQAYATVSVPQCLRFAAFQAALQAALAPSLFHGDEASSGCAVNGDELPAMREPSLAAGLCHGESSAMYRVHVRMCEGMHVYWTEHRP